MAIADHPWVDSANGAAVRIAMTVLAPGAGEGQLFTVTGEQPGEHGEMAVTLAERSGLIHADLSVGPMWRRPSLCRPWRAFHRPA